MVNVIFQLTEHILRQAQIRGGQFFARAGGNAVYHHGPPSHFTMDRLLTSQWKKPELVEVRVATQVM